MAVTAFDRALIEESAKKSGLVWVRSRDLPRARALWHVWHDGAVCVVGGPGEQPLDGIGGDGVVVSCRSKDKGGRLIDWPAQVTELTPGTEEWQATAAALAAKRLNAADADGMAARWAAECRVLRLTPA